MTYTFGAGSAARALAAVSVYRKRTKIQADLRNFAPATGKLLGWEGSLAKPQAANAGSGLLCVYHRLRAASSMAATSWRVGSPRASPRNLLARSSRRAHS